MKVIDCAQRSSEWYAARLGMLTASSAADMLKRPHKDGSEAAGRRNLRIRLVLERVTKRSQESGYVSAAMAQGMEREVDAQAIYEGLTGRVLRTVGFCQHDTLMAGCSPDGVIGDFEGIVEAKCPIPATHWEYLRTGQIPTEYLHQVHAALWLTGAQWCDWFSYNPDFPESLQAKLVRVELSDLQKKAFEVMVRAFLSEVDREVETLMKMAGAAA